MAILELKKIKKSYKLGKLSTEVLHGIDIQFEKGQFVSILGESGCGKSTLMNIIGGLDSDYKGEVLIDGKTLKNFSQKNLDDYRKDKVGFIFQSFNLVSHLSALGNVELAMTMSDMSGKRRKERAITLLKNLGLEGHLYKKPNQLSGGQKQRVAIARALANDPDILLADEPTGNLDSKTAEQILDILQDISNRGKLVIAVTHSSKVANRGTKVVKMSNGKIIEEQTLKENNDVIKEDKKIRLKPLKFIEAIKLAFNNMKLNLGRNILVSLGTSIGISSMVLMLSLGNGVESFIREEIESSLDPLTIDISKNSSGEERTPGQNHLSINEGFSADDISYIEKISGVTSVEYIWSYVMKASFVYNKQSYTPLIFSTMDGTIGKDDIIYGNPPQTGIIISKSMASDLSKNNVDNLIGQSIITQIPVVKNDGTMTYISKEVPIDGVYESAEMDYGNAKGAYIKYDQLSLLYKQNNFVLRPTSVKAHVKSEDEIYNVKETLKDNGYNGSRQDELLEQVTEYLNIAVAILTGIAGISLVVSAIMILVVLYISVVERTREIGILRAIGARKKDIRRVFFAESTLLGLMGGIFGIATAGLISVIGNRVLERLFDASFIKFTLIYAIFGIAISTVVSIVAGLIPASKAAKLDPIESLRHE